MAFHISVYTPTFSLNILYAEIMFQNDTIKLASHLASLICVIAIPRNIFLNDRRHGKVLGNDLKS